MFLNSDFTAYIDDSDSSVVESNSFMVDINGRYTFRLFNSNFNLEGHIDNVILLWTSQVHKNEKSTELI